MEAMIYTESHRHAGCYSYLALQNAVDRFTLDIPARYDTDLNYIALLLAILAPEPVDPDRAVAAIYECKQIEPVRFTIPKETLIKCIRLQRKKGASLKGLKEGFKIKQDISNISRQMRKYKHEILLDYTEISPSWASQKAKEMSKADIERVGQNEEVNSTAAAIC